ncbi:MAG: ATP-dependent helicase HrpB [Spirochaetaceae bacterium]|nr:ATP-dependent helicase HrpB [Spirochaetaceae bacterium]
MQSLKTHCWRDGVTELPIAASLDSIITSLKNAPSRSLVLTAETAAGKSTLVPLALMEAFPGKILVTEPRRLAAVAVATRHSELLGEAVGQRVGYRLRYDTQVSAATRIEVMTDAILTRIIQKNPALDEISVIVLDEFHERSVHTDLCLAFLKEIMSLRDDLYLVVMSATMDAEKVAEFLGEQTPILHVAGRQFPVEIQYHPPKKSQSGFVEKTVLLSACVATIMDELRNPLNQKDCGAILAFLPGIGEIRECSRLLETLGGGELAEILLLHSSISLEEQKKVLSGSDSCQRRVILSSSIAETSLTVPDVTVVIDCGLSRVSRFHHSTGMSRLVTEVESSFSAEQRAGRAGRLQAGRCVRLWSQDEKRLASPPPEISRTDLLPVVLECVRWGVSNVDGLEWLDNPSSGGWNAAIELLQTMACLDSQGSITELGHRVLELGVHPRIGCVALSGEPEALRLAARYGSSDSVEEKRLFADLQRKVRSSSLKKATGDSKEQSLSSDSSDSSLALLYGFPDRLAKLVGEGRYQFPSGRTAQLASRSLSQTPHASSLPQWIVGVEVDAGASTGRILRWEPLASGPVEAWLQDHTTEAVELDVDDNSGKVVKHQVKRYGKLELERRRLVPDSCDVAQALCSQLRRKGFESLPLSSQSESLLLRCNLLHEIRGKERVEKSSLMDALEQWLLPFLGSSTKLTADVVYQGLYWFCEGSLVDQEIPLVINLPNGKRRKLKYEIIVGKTTPVLEVIIQDMFGCFETPVVAGIPVLLRLLSPASRPLQVTSDLAGFWDTSWPQICKEMKGRYPKHNWDYKKS